MHDASWKPNTDPGMAARRADMLQRAHNFFRQRELLAVDTPALSVHTVADPHFESITAASVHRPALYLQT